MTTLDQNNLSVVKSDDDKKLVFGWASVSARVEGEPVVDYQNDMIELDELEAAAYEYAVAFSNAGEMHQRGGVGRLVESVVFTKEKAAAMRLPEGFLPKGWWVGFKITDDEVWAKIKTGEYNMFSIEGTAKRQAV